MNKTTYTITNATVNAINARLQELGAEFHCELTVTTKNNVDKEGLTLKSESNIAPVIYAESLPEELEDQVSYLMSAFENYKDPDFSLHDLLDKSYVLSHVLPAVCSDSNKERFAAKGLFLANFMDMLVYFYVPVMSDKNANGSINITFDLLKSMELDPVDVYYQAIQNIEKTYTIRNMGEILSSMGMSYPCETPLWVISTDNNYRGAAMILSLNVISELHKLLGNSFILLPSSVHEMIAVSTEEFEQNMEFTKMVAEVNATQVDEVDRLVDHAYRVDQFLISNI